MGRSFQMISLMGSGSRPILREMLFMSHLLILSVVFWKYWVSIYGDLFFIKLINMRVFTRLRLASGVLKMLQLRSKLSWLYLKHITLIETFFKVVFVRYVPNLVTIRMTQIALQSGLFHLNSKFGQMLLARWTSVLAGTGDGFLEFPGPLL